MSMSSMNLAPTSWTAWAVCRAASRAAGRGSVVVESLMVPDATGTGSHRGGRTTTSDLVARDRSRTGDVQRRQVAVQRDRRHQVAALGGQPRQALALGPEDEADRVGGDGQVVHRHLAPRV